MIYVRQEEDKLEINNKDDIPNFFDCLHKAGKGDKLNSFEYFILNYCPDSVEKEYSFYQDMFDLICFIKSNEI